MLLFSLWFGAVLATNRLIATPSGLVYWWNLRRKSFGWPEVRSVTVGRSHSVVQGLCPVIKLDNKAVTLTGLASFTTGYADRVVSELTAMHREFRLGPAPGGDPSEAALS